MNSPALLKENLVIMTSFAGSMAMSMLLFSFVMQQLDPEIFGQVGDSCLKKRKKDSQRNMTSRIDSKRVQEESWNPFLGRLHGRDL